MKAILPFLLEFSDDMTAQALDDAVSEAQAVLVSNGIASRIGKIQWQAAPAKGDQVAPRLNAPGTSKGRVS